MGSPPYIYRGAWIPLRNGPLPWVAALGLEPQLIEARAPVRVDVAPNLIAHVIEELGLVPVFRPALGLRQLPPRTRLPWEDNESLVRALIGATNSDNTVTAATAQKHKLRILHGLCPHCFDGAPLLQAWVNTRHPELGVQDPFRVLTRNCATVDSLAWTNSTKF